MTLWNSMQHICVHLCVYDSTPYPYQSINIQTRITMKQGIVPFYELLIPYNINARNGTKVPNLVL